RDAGLHPLRAKAAAAALPARRCHRRPPGPGAVDRAPGLHGRRLLLGRAGPRPSLVGHRLSRPGGRRPDGGRPGGPAVPLAAPAGPERPGDRGRPHLAVAAARRPSRGHRLRVVPGALRRDARGARALARRPGARPLVRGHGIHLAGAGRPRRPGGPGSPGLGNLAATARGPSLIRLTVPPEAEGTRLDVFLASVLPEHSRSALRRMILSGRVLLDGRPP